jgi:hypothetical protein
MKKSISFTLDLPHHLFWDVDLENFDNIRNKRLIIERVFTLGDLSDLKEIISFYGMKTIKEEIVKAGNLDNKTLAWASLFLGIPKSHFRCYTKRQSNKTHWNY